MTTHTEVRAGFELWESEWQLAVELGWIGAATPDFLSLPFFSFISFVAHPTSLRVFGSTL